MLSELLAKKRDGETLSDHQIEWLVAAFHNREITDYQMSALLMAIFIRGLNEAETEALTRAMLMTGERLQLSALPARKVDKHSTGGVGDKTSLILAPVVAACGLKVPMISGRGLGHTGGTLDKLEAIPGLTTQLSTKEIVSQLGSINLVMAGQSETLAPVDRRMYALRDVTATVESIPLITASIMSKKLAADLDALILDIKVGDGAFMPSLEKGQQLAASLIQVGRRFGLPIVALLTDMSYPLGCNIGNWLEVVEVLDVLNGAGEPALRKLSIELAAEMLCAGGVFASLEEARAVAGESLDTLSAFAVFEQMVASQGGKTAYIESPHLMPRADWIIPVEAPQSGFWRGFQARRAGMLAMKLGAGRKKADEAVDPLAGIVCHLTPGTEVQKGSVVAELHTNYAGGHEDYLREISATIVIENEVFANPDLLLHRLTSDADETGQ
jgi:pyrimidine-nucleoside phosphorylase